MPLKKNGNKRMLKIIFHRMRKKKKKKKPSFCKFTGKGKMYLTVNQGSWSKILLQVTLDHFY